MNSPLGGTSCQEISMRMGSHSRRKKWTMLWKLYHDQSGQTKFRRIIEEEPTKLVNMASIAAIMPRRILDDKVKLCKLLDAVGKEGGSTTSVKGRTISISVGTEDSDNVCEVLDSFGCQWDTE